MISDFFNNGQRKLDQLEREMSKAMDYSEWKALAAEHDRESGNEDWRHNDKSSLFDYRNINSRLENLTKLRKDNDSQGLLFALNEGIHGNMGGMGHAKLHTKAKCGSKYLIENYVKEIEDSLLSLAPSEECDIPLDERIEFFERASHCYGRTALMLSGGGTLGYFHLGVLKTLIEHKMVPAVISGASAGSFVAAVVGTRNDREFLKLFENDKIQLALTENNEELSFGFGSGQDIDMDLIKEGMARLIPDLTFEEAFRKTGRSINISVSPSEPKQSSRLLNHIASPNVLIRSAVLASTALPGVFKPVLLEARNAQGKKQPYLPSRRWMDGSFSQDLPAKRLARMYGVNHFIVSQVMPVIGSEKKQRPFLNQLVADAVVAASKQLVRGSLDVLKNNARLGPNVATALNAMNSLLDQSYSGDINIFPNFGILSLGKILKKLTLEETAEIIKAGERATWPKVATIATTTRVGRALDGILHEYEQVHWLHTSPKTSEAPTAIAKTTAKRVVKKKKVDTKKKVSNKNATTRKELLTNSRKSAPAVKNKRAS
ncbi:MAG: DUF3336 domain-containing protein [Pseudomonadales bacterium]